jgi:hypothetical protein
MPGSGYQSADSSASLNNPWNGEGLWTVTPSSPVGPERDHPKKRAGPSSLPVEVRARWPEANGPAAAPGTATVTEPTP